MGWGPSCVEPPVMNLLETQNVAPRVLHSNTCPTMPPTHPPACPQELLVKGPVVDNSQEFSQIQSKLSVEELQLFAAAREAALAHAAWVDPNSHR